jgi:hypothetical protein
MAITPAKGLEVAYKGSDGKSVAVKEVTDPSRLRRKGCETRPPKSVFYWIMRICLVSYVRC